MNFHQLKKFAVISFSDTQVRGTLFQRSRDGLSVPLTAEENISPEDPSVAWKSVLRQMGRGKDYPLYLTGSLKDGVCFDAVQAELAPRFQRQAIEMELPRHLLSVPKRVHFQFIPLAPPEQGSVPFRVYAVPGNAFESLAAMLTQGNSRADGYLYPALALEPEDPPFFAPEMDPELSFCDGSWRVMPEQETPWKEWKKRLSQEMPPVKADDSFFRDHLLHILIARLILKHGSYPGLNILPERIRPKRMQDQLKVTAILAVILILNLLWSCAGDWKSNFLAMRSVRQEITVLQQENAKLKRILKSKEKQTKELSRLVHISAGEHQLEGKLADLSSVIPANFLTTSLRWSESGVELQLQSTDTQTDLTGTLRRLPYWKIGQLQQRRFGNSESTMITLKLVPAEVKK